MVSINAIQLIEKQAKISYTTIYQLFTTSKTDKKLSYLHNSHKTRTMHSYEELFWFITPTSR